MHNLIDFFSVCGVAVILVGDRNKMAIAQILSNPQIIGWDKFKIADKRESIPELR